MTTEPVRVPAAVGVKVKYMLQLTDVVIGSEVQVLDGRVKSPVVSMSEMTRGLAPTLDRTTVMALLVVLMPCFPKLWDAGVAEAAGVVTPVPVSVTIKGLAGSSEVITSEPVRAPDTVGAKATFIVQLTDVAIGSAVQVLEGMEKSPVVSISEILRGFDPTLVSTTLRVALVVLTPWLPKASEVGEAEATAEATPVPVNVTVRGLFGSLLVMVTEPVLAPATVGVNVTVTAHVVDVVREAPLQVLVARAKSPDAVTVEITRGFVPRLDTVTVWEALVIFTPWFPKASDVGAADAAIDTVDFSL
jgi:hypothetical protein